MYLFGNRPGVIGTAITGPALPFGIVVGGNEGVYVFPKSAVGKGIITGFDDEGESGFGVSHTLRDRIYFWVFGERAGSAEVSGMAFMDTCGPNGQSTPWTGFDVIKSYYEQVRVSTTGLPVQLVFGPRTTVWGFLTRYKYSLTDATSGVGTFSFRFVTIPRPTAGVFRPAPVWPTE